MNLSFFSTPTSRPDDLLQVAQFLKTLAHPDRLLILRCLGRFGRLNVTSLQQQLPINQATLSQHLTKMTDRGILLRQRRGKEAYYSLTHPKLIRLFDMLPESV